VPPVELAVLEVIAVPRVALIVEFAYEKNGAGTGGAALLHERLTVPVPPPAVPFAFAVNKSKCSKVVSATPRLFGFEIAVHEVGLSESNGVFKTAHVEASPDVGKVCNGENVEVYLWVLEMRVGPKFILLTPVEFPSPPNATLLIAFWSVLIVKAQRPASCPFTNMIELALTKFAAVGTESAM
jgi:hypothetical protein